MKHHKPFDKMNAKELAAATAEYDVPGARPKFLTPTTSEKRRHDQILRRAKRGRGRPVIGAGSKKIHTSIKADLLADTDKLAKKRGVKRAELIEQGLRLVLQEA